MYSVGRWLGSDEELALLARLKKRDESALRLMVEAYGPAVFGLALRRLNDRMLADEVAQDVFVALWERPERFEAERGNLRSYLFRITRNKAVDAIRREQSSRDKRNRLQENLVVEASGRDSNAPDPAATVDRREVLVSLLSELTEVQQEIIVLVYFGGRTCHEAALELDIPEGTAKSRLRDALINLRKSRMGNDG